MKVALTRIWNKVVLEVATFITRSTAPSCTTGYWKIFKKYYNRNSPNDIIFEYSYVVKYNKKFSKFGLQFHITFCSFRANAVQFSYLEE